MKQMSDPLGGVADARLAVSATPVAIAPAVPRNWRRLNESWVKIGLLMNCLLVKADAGGAEVMLMTSSRDPAAIFPSLAELFIRLNFST
jgi:hypothetical protein